MDYWNLNQLFDTHTVTVCERKVFLICCISFVFSLGFYCTVLFFLPSLVSLTLLVSEYPSLCPSLFYFLSLQLSVLSIFTLFCTLSFFFSLPLILFPPLHLSLNLNFSTFIFLAIKQEDEVFKHLIRQASNPSLFFK